MNTVPLRGFVSGSFRRLELMQKPIIRPAARLARWLK
jgi:hypothetical protein